MLDSLIVNILFFNFFFLFPILIHLLLQHMLSFLELFNDLLGSWNWTLHPWVSLNFWHWWSMIWLKLHHAGKKLFQFLGEELISFWFIFAVSFPENVWSVSSKTLVEWIIFLSSSEWRVLSNHNEKNNGWCEKIDLLSHIWLF